MKNKMIDDEIKKVVKKVYIRSKDYLFLFNNDMNNSDLAKYELQEIINQLKELNKYIELKENN